MFLQGEIHTGNANEVVMKLLYLQSENRRKDIHFYLNSPGGDVIATLAIYDTMQMLSCPIATYCVGSSGQRGCRAFGWWNEGETLLFAQQPRHGSPTRWWRLGADSDIEIQANEILRYRDVLNHILANHTARRSSRLPKMLTAISS